MWKVVSLAAVVLAGAVIAAGAAPVPWTDINGMIAGADLIVAGRVSSTEADDAFTVMTATVETDAVLKGSGRPRAPLTIRLELPNEAARSLVEGEYGIFFLKRGRSDRDYIAVDPYHVIVTVVPGSVPAEPDGSASEAVAQALVQVLATPAEVLLDPVAGAGGSRAVGPYAAENAIWWETAALLTDMPAEYSRTAARRAYATVPPGERRLWLARVLVELGDTSVLPSHKAAMLAPKPNETDAVAELARAVERNVREDSMIPLMTALMTSRSLDVRQAASRVLAEARDGRATDALLEHGLDDPDETVRYHAVFGLENNDGDDQGGPSVGVFERNEQKFLDYWRAKAKARKTR